MSCEHDLEKCVWPIISCDKIFKFLLKVVFPGFFKFLFQWAIQNVSFNILVMLCYKCFVELSQIPISWDWLLVGFLL